MSWLAWRKRADCVKEGQNNITTSLWERYEPRAYFGWWAVLWTLWNVVLELRIQQSSLVDVNDFPCCQLSGWLVTASLSVFVAYGHVTGWWVLRIFQVVPLLPHLACPVFSWLHVHSWTSAHLKPWTTQDVITPCSSHSCLSDPGSFVLWKNLGSGAHSSVWYSSPSPPSAPPTTHAHTPPPSHGSSFGLTCLVFKSQLHFIWIGVYIVFHLAFINSSQNVLLHSSIRRFGKYTFVE